MMPLLYMMAAACVALAPNAARVTARDLTPAYPAMAALDPGTAIAAAPAPGVPRILHPPELRSLAARFHLDAAPEGDICIERPVAALDPAQLLEALRAAMPEARIEVVDYSRRFAPAGELEFARAGLRPPLQGNVALWNGAVVYGAGARFPIWAKARVTVAVKRVIALADLVPERAIGIGQILAETRQEFPVEGEFATASEDVIGKWPRVSIRAGSEIRGDRLSDPKAVARGQNVHVDVSAGAAHLEFDGVAETSGAVGECVQVRNPISGRRFRARVEGRDRVSVKGTL